MSFKKYDAVIFDVDGTLTSTNELIFASFNHIIEKYQSRKCNDEEIIALFGPPEDIIIDKIFPGNTEEVKKDYYAFYESNHGMAALYPGVKELLTKLKEQNVILATFTGKGRRAALITLDKLGILPFFDLVITGDEVVKHKPDAEGLFLFFKSYPLNKDRVLMVGDAPPDIQASRQAGIQIASVVWDSYAKEEVIKLNSDFIFHTVAELSAFLLKT